MNFGFYKEYFNQYVEFLITDVCTVCPGRSCKILHGNSPYKNGQDFRQTVVYETFERVIFIGKINFNISKF